MSRNKSVKNRSKWSSDLTDRRPVSTPLLTATARVTTTCTASAPALRHEVT